MRHFKVSPVLKIEETVYKEAESMWMETGNFRNPVEKKYFSYTPKVKEPMWIEYCNLAHRLHSLPHNKFLSKNKLEICAKFSRKLAQSFTFLRESLHPLEILIAKLFNWGLTQFTIFLKYDNILNNKSGVVSPSHKKIFSWLEKCR